jgi:hypothetical protein
MCLTTDNPEIQIAAEDITVYKKVIVRYKENTNRNFFQKLFGLNKTTEIYEALIHHFFYQMGKPEPIVELVATPILNVFEVEKGYHSDAQQVPSANAICVIPKGTKFIYGWYNEEKHRPNYVSETIILKKII